MSSPLLIRLRAAGPFRFGSMEGDRLTTLLFGHSDLVYRAVSSALRLLGEGDAWRGALGEIDPPVRFTSLYPFAGRALFVPPPRHLWPPAHSARIRWKAARLAPLTLVADLLSGKPVQEDRWEIDTGSGCVIAAGSTAPFRMAIRESAALDRASGQAAPHRTACLEFQPNAGLWTVARFRDEDAGRRWAEPVKAAFRLLADTGFGGERSIGWGQTAAPEFLADPFATLPASPDSTAYWLLSLYNPSPEDAIDWTAGSYDFTPRAGRDEDPAPMAIEGSVLTAERAPLGRLVGPAGRSGLAFAIPLPSPAAPEPAG